MNRPQGPIYYHEGEDFYDQQHRPSYYEDYYDKNDTNFNPMLSHPCEAPNTPGPSGAPQMEAEDEPDELNFQLVEELMNNFLPFIKIFTNKGP